MKNPTYDLTDTTNNQTHDRHANQISSLQFRKKRNLKIGFKSENTQPNRMQDCPDREHLESRMIELLRHKYPRIEQLEEHLEQQYQECPHYDSNSNLSNHRAINRDTLGVIMKFLSVRDVIRLSQVNHQFRRIVTSDSFDPFWRNRIEDEFRTKSVNLNTTGRGVTLWNNNDDTAPKLLWYHVFEYWVRLIGRTTLTRTFHTFFRERYRYLNDGANLPRRVISDIKNLGIPNNSNESGFRTYKQFIPFSAVIFDILPTLSKTKRYTADQMVEHLKSHFCERVCWCHTTSRNSMNDYILFLSPKLISMIRRYHDKNNIKNPWRDWWDQEHSLQLNAPKFIAVCLIFPVFPYLRGDILCSFPAPS